MIAETVAIGDELVHGFALDTNSGHIARELEALGVDVRRATVVSDEPHALQEAIVEACVRADLVVATGGLGPTEDDRTRDVAAAAAGVELRFDAPSWEHLERWFERRGRVPPESNRRQAWLPTGAQVLDNRWGTAPGFSLAIGQGTLFCLPGVPREMRGMLEQHVAPWVRARDTGGAFAFHQLRTLGLHEAELGERLADLMLAGRNPRVGVTAHYGMMTIRVAARGADREAAQVLCDATVADIRGRARDVLVSEGDAPLEALVVEALRKAGRTVALAESCTGGLLAARLTDVAGASAVFRDGFVTYHDDAKAARLGVDRELLATAGAVSEPVVRAMVAGLQRETGADWAVAISGIAGPGGGSDEKPVGTVWFAIGGPAGVVAWEQRFAALGRRFVRERAVFEALAALLRSLVELERDSG